MKAMTKHRTHSIDFKRQVAQEFLAGETLHGLAGRHDVSRNLIRIWIEKYEAGAFDEDAQAADLLQCQRRSKNQPRGGAKVCQLTAPCGEGWNGFRAPAAALAK